MEIKLRTYIVPSPEIKGYSCVCIDFSGVGQGGTPEEALDNLIDSIMSMLKYDQENRYSKTVPAEFYDEYESGDYAKKSLVLSLTPAQESE